VCVCVCVCMCVIAGKYRDLPELSDVDWSLLKLEVNGKCQFKDFR